MKRGFTLIELVIVIAIIGILAATVAPSMSGYVMRARDTARQSDLYNISLALSSYILAEEAYPAHASGCYPYASLSGYTTKKYVSPSGTGYNEGCGNNGLYGYSVTSGSYVTPSYILMSRLENPIGGNYTGSTIGFTGELLQIAVDNILATAKKGAGSIYVFRNGDAKGSTPVANGACSLSTQFSCAAGTSALPNAGTCGGSSTWSCLGTGGGSSINCTLANAPCPINGGWSAWSAWGSCSLACGGGTQNQTRTCTNPAPANGGSACVGSTSQSQACNTQACPVNCSYNTTGWSACSASCGGGWQSYYYNITAPAQNGGTCPVTQGQVAGSQMCNTQSCITYSYYGLSGAPGGCGAIYGGYQEILFACVRNANGVFDGYEPWPWSNCPGLADGQGHWFKTCAQPFDGNWTYF